MDNTLLFITLGAIVVLLIAYNIALVKLKRHIAVLDEATMDVLVLFTQICRAISNSSKDLTQPESRTSEQASSDSDNS